MNIIERRRLMKYLGSSKEPKSEKILAEDA
jgi:hypothetical protein